MVGCTRTSTPPSVGLGDGQELDRVAQLARVGDVRARDAADALGVDVLEVHEGPEGQGDEDLELVGGVEALDVERRIGLRVAAGLGLLEHLGEVEPLVGHPGQDVVAGAVDDAGHGEDAVGDQPVLDGADEGNAAGHRRLEGEGHAPAARLVVELDAVVGEEGLVGRHDVLAGGQGLQDERAGRLQPAHQLHDHVDGRVVEDGGGVRGQGQPREVEPLAGTRQVEVGDARAAGGDSRRALRGWPAGSPGA